MLAVIIAYLFGAGTVLLLLLIPSVANRLIRAKLAHSRHAAELEEVVTEFGEELAHLAFDPGALGVPPESVADYRRALDSYEKAKHSLDADPGDLDPVRQALAVGRNALIRLDARTQGRPVPIDISRAVRSSGAPIQPQAHQDMRFSYSGSNARSYVIPIDWPEPGQPAIIAVTRNGTGMSQLGAWSITTEAVDEEPDGSLKEWFWLHGSMQGRFYLHADPLSAPTHLKIVPLNEGRMSGSWSLRLLPLGEAVELRREHQGVGPDGHGRGFRRNMIARHEFRPRRDLDLR